MIQRETLGKVGAGSKDVARHYKRCLKYCGREQKWRKKMALHAGYLLLASKVDYL